MRRLCLLLTLLSMMSSCGGRKYYAPNLQNVPLFREKGEMRFSGGIAVGEDVESRELQAAYAFTDKLGVMLNAQFTRDFDSRGFVVEGAGGYYRPMRQGHAFELYGGAGIGKAPVNRYYSVDSPNTFDLRFTKFFAQPDFGIRRKFFEAAISTRFTALHFYRINTTSNIPGLTFPLADYIRSHSSSLLAEPAFILRAGHPSVKFQLQVSNSLNLTASDLPQENIMLGFGVFISARRQTHR